MKNIAFIFTRTPYGSSVGLEGLNAALSISTFTTDIGLFFIGDGVLQLYSQQNANVILNHCYLSTFSVLKCFNIKSFFLSKDSLTERGLLIANLYKSLHIKIITLQEIRKQLTKYNHILTF
ncbi:MAG: sulfurtransferase complex subunit TusC [Pantoea sp. Brub]|nr:sulfurtransferase complex subunit TusC [Pantoea sp. Brub]